MFARAYALVLLLATPLATAACGEDEKPPNPISPNNRTLETCDTEKRPILFVHGFLGGGDNFELQAQRFSSNGYCRAAIRNFDYDSFPFFQGTAADAAAAQSKTDADLDAAVDALRKDSGFDQIDLVGHSLGTIISTAYLSKPEHASKIAHYANAAGSNAPKPVPTVNLSSDGDKVVGRLLIQGGNNPDIGYHDHVAVLTCKESFAAMYQFFNGTAPKALEPVPEETIEISGFYRDFSDNLPHAGVTIQVFEIDPDTGERLNDRADVELTTTETGAFGPFVAKPKAYYEFFEPDAGEDGRPQHTYRAPLVRSTHLMYLKAFPKTGSGAAGLLAGKFPYDDTQAGLVIQHSNRAMIGPDTGHGTGKDSLTVNGSELLTPEVSPESRQLIALFALDQNSNEQSDLTVLPNLTNPFHFFLSGIDLALPTSETKPIEVVFDHVTLHAHRWPSQTQGASLILLDN